MAKDQDTFELAVAIQALTARHEVLTIAVQESLRALDKSQADQCATAIRARVQAIATSAPLLAIPQADEAIAQELTAILSALSNGAN